MDDDDYDPSDSSLSDVDEALLSSGSDGEDDGGGEDDGSGEPRWLVDELKKEKDDNDSGAPLTAWKIEVHRAFLRGIHLVPNLGVSRWPLGNQRFKRNILISEFIVRQTGVYRSSRQVSGHLNAIRRSKRKLSKGFRTALRGRHVPHAELKKIDFDQLLGPDNYPNVKVRARRSAGWKVHGVERKRKSSPSSAARGPEKVPPRPEATFAKPPRVASSSHSRIESSPASQRPAETQDLASSPSSWAPASSSAHEPLPLSHPSLFQPLSTAPPPLAPPSSSHPFLADLTAFLTSFHPSRDHVPTARALLSLGVDSLSRIVELLALEPSSLELLCAHLRKEGALGALDVAWLKKVVGLAREACASGE